MRFALEIKNWIHYEVEHAFEDVDSARRYGVERFSQNDWRVRDTYADIVVYQYDPVKVFEEAAALEIKRFEDSDRWARRYADRRVQEIVAGQQRERMGEIAARQRGGISKRRKNPVTEPVNWKVEGF